PPFHHEFHSHRMTGYGRQSFLNPGFTLRGVAKTLAISVLAGKRNGQSVWRRNCYSRGMPQAFPNHSADFNQCSPPDFVDIFRSKRQLGDYGGCDWSNLRRNLLPQKWGVDLDAGWRIGSGRKRGGSADLEWATYRLRNGIGYGLRNGRLKWRF